MARITTWDCCDQQRLSVDEAFSYVCEVDQETGRLFVNINDYCTDGLQDLVCFNCGKSFDIQADFHEVDS